MDLGVIGDSLRSAQYAVMCSALCALSGIGLACLASRVSKSIASISKGKHVAAVALLSAASVIVGGTKPAQNSEGQYTNEVGTVVSATITLWPTNSKSALFKMGTVNPSVVEKITNSPYGYLPSPYLAGFVFDGWYTDPVDGDLITPVTMVTSTNPVTLFSHWHVFNYTLSFDLSGAPMTDTMNQSFTNSFHPYDTWYSVPPPTWDRYHEFSHWVATGYNESSALNSITSGIAVRMTNDPPMDVAVSPSNKRVSFTRMNSGYGDDTTTYLKAQWIDNTPSVVSNEYLKQYLAKFTGRSNRYLPHAEGLMFPTNFLKYRINGLELAHKLGYVTNGLTHWFDAYYFNRTNWYQKGINSYGVKSFLCKDYSGNARRASFLTQSSEDEIDTWEDLVGNLSMKSIDGKMSRTVSLTKVYDAPDNPSDPGLGGMYNSMQSAAIRPSGDSGMYLPSDRIAESPNLQVVMCGPSDEPYNSYMQDFVPVTQTVTQNVTNAIPGIYSAFAEVSYNASTPQMVFSRFAGFCRSASQIKIRSSDSYAVGTYDPISVCSLYWYFNDPTNSFLVTMPSGWPWNQYVDHDPWYHWKLGLFSYFASDKYLHYGTYYLDRNYRQKPVSVVDVFAFRVLNQSDSALIDGTSTNINRYVNIFEPTYYYWAKQYQSAWDMERDLGSSIYYTMMGYVESPIYTAFWCACNLPSDTMPSELRQPQSSLQYIPMNGFHINGVAFTNKTSGVIKRFFTGRTSFGEYHDGSAFPGRQYGIRRIMTYSRELTEEEFIQNSYVDHSRFSQYDGPITNLNWKMQFQSIGTISNDTL